MNVLESAFIVNKNEIKKSPYAVYDVEMGELTIRNEPWVGSSYISLKDIKYLVKDGVLYIKGTRLFYSYVNSFVREPLSWWSEPDLYDFTNIDLSGHEPVQLITYTRKSFWGLIKRTFKNVYDAAAQGHWIKKNKEKEFLYSLHPFKLHE